MPSLLSEFVSDDIVTVRSLLAPIRFIEFFNASCRKYGQL